MSKESVEAKVSEVLRQECPYNVPPFSYLGGHSFCPCISQALKIAYCEGYTDGQEKQDPQLGRCDSENTKEN